MILNIEQIIKKKRDGEELTREEIEFFIKSIASGKAADYHIAAWAMAVYFQGMTRRETTDLALAMAYSGETVDLSGVEGITVDKHSTGGVGDKTTPVVVPLVAAAGVPVAKVSGKSLGFTGGTIDKFQSIPGFQSEMSRDDFTAQVNRIKAVVIAQSENLVPADKRIYAIRDVTATVDSIPLIASSVMSKKIAAGAQAIVLDVKVGGGAFMKDLDQAVNLAQTMVSIGQEAGRQVAAVLSSMEKPLGYAVGNALEIEEAVNTLQGRGPKDLEELSLFLASHMLVLGSAASDLEAAQSKLRTILDSGRGFDKFCEMVEAQGGKVETIANLTRVRHASLQVVAKSPCSGFVKAIQAEKIGRIAMMLGAGRQKAGDRVDYSVGVVLRKKPGDFVESNEPLAMLYANDPYKLEAARGCLVDAFTWQEDEPDIDPLILGIVK